MAQELTWKATIDPAIAVRALRELGAEHKKTAASVAQDARAMQREVAAAWAQRDAQERALLRSSEAAWKQHESEKLAATRTAEKQGEAAVAASNAAKEQLSRRETAVRRQQEAELLATVKRMERERQQIAAQNARAIAALAKSEADARIREGRRAASALIASLREQVREAQRAAQQQRAATTGRTSAFVAGAVGGVTALLGVSAINEIRQAGAAWVDYASKLQTTRIAFTQMMGSATLAEEHLKALQAFALKTPFQFSDLIDASQRMQALGFNAQQVIPILTDVGNAVAAAGGGAERLDRVTLALAQMQSKGKVATQEMNQLAEAGLPGWKILEQQLGKSRAELVKMVEQGQISSQVFLEAFQKFSQQNFGGLMEQQSKTFTGAMSNIKDALLQSSEEGFRPLYQRINETAIRLSDLSTNSKEFRDDMKQVGGVIVTIWDGIVEAIHIVKDAVSLVAAAIIGQMTAMSAVVMALADSFMNAYHAARALGAFMMGDFKTASDQARLAQDSLNRTMIDLKTAINAEGSVVREFGRMWTEAGERAAVAGQQMSQAAANASVGTTFLQRALSSAQSQLPPPAPPATSRGGKAATEKVSEGQRLLNSLMDDYERIQAKINNLTKSEVIQAELKKKIYDDINPTLKQQIQIYADLITTLEKTADVNKKIEEEEKKAAEERAEEFRAARDLFQKRLDLESQIATAVQEQREVLSGLQGFEKSHLQIVEEYIVKTVAEAEAVGGVTEKMREYFKLLIQIAAKEDEMVGKKAWEQFGKEIGTPDAKAFKPQNSLNPFQEALGKINEKFGEGSASAARFAVALQGIEAVASGVANAVGQAVQAFVMFGKVEGGFRKFAAELISQIAAMAAAQAVFELAQGLAWLALNAFFPNPKYAEAAGLAFASAAVFGAVAGVATLAGRAVAGNAFAQASGTGSSGGSSGSSGGSSERQTPPTYREEWRKPQHIYLHLESNDSHVVKVIKNNVAVNGELRTLIVEVAK